VCAAEELRKVQGQAQEAAERGNDAEWRRWQGVCVCVCVCVCGCVGVWVCVISLFLSLSLFI